MLLRLNKQLIPEIASLRDAERETFSRTQSRKKAVTDRVHAREAATAATAPGAHRWALCSIVALFRDCCTRGRTWILCNIFFRQIFVSPALL